MTGGGAFYGQQMSRGMELAVEEINAAGGVDGVPLELHIEDHSHGDPKKGLSGFQRIQSLYNIPITTSSYTAPTLAIQSFVETAPKDKKCLILQGGAWSPKLMRLSYLYNNRLTGSSLVVGMVDWAWKEFGGGKLAQLYALEPASTDSAVLTALMWKEFGGEAVADQKAPREATDFTSQVAVIKGAKPDLLTLWWCGTTHSIQLKQSYEFGVAVPTIGLDFIPGHTPEVAREAMRQYYWVADEFIPEVITCDIGRRFISLYEGKKYKEQPSPEKYAANYYDAVYVMRDCILEAKKGGGDYYTGDRLVEALEKIKTFPSVYGELTYDVAEHGCFKDFFIMRWDADKKAVVLVKTIPASAVPELSATAKRLLEKK